MSHIPTSSVQRGFTLIEVLTAVSIAAVLSSIAVPTFNGAIQKARRSEALVAMLKVQLAQERWYSNNRRYGNLAEIGAAASSAGGHYRFEVAVADEQRFEARALAQGAQARDTDCRVLALRSDGSSTTRVSGPDDTLANPPAANRRCWGV